MTQIIFYILDEQRSQNLTLFVCKLTDKLFSGQNTIAIHSGNESQAEEINQQLWHFKASSFIPHINLNESQSIEDTPVVIYTKEQQLDSFNPESKEESLINLTPETPKNFSRFHYLLEIVKADERLKKQARIRYQFYKKYGFAIKTHNLSA